MEVEMEAASERGEEDEDEDEDEDLYYIPPRRPSLDLGPSPMDLNYRFITPPASPVQNYGSMTSGNSSEEMEADDGSRTGLVLDREGSFTSVSSCDSGDSERKTRKSRANQGTAAAHASEAVKVNPETNEFNHPSLTVPFTFKAICSVLQKLSLKTQDAFRRNLWKLHSQPLFTPLQHLDQVDLVNLVDGLLERYSLQESLQITKSVLLELGQKQAVEHLHRLCLQNETQHELRELLKQKFSEGWVVDGEKRSCDQVFIDLHLSAGSDYGPNVEHEVLIINPLHTNKKEAQQQISPEHMLSPAYLQHTHTQLLLLTGVASSGKSTLVRKLVLDWAEQRSYQHFTFLFPVTFRELRALGDAQVSLLSLLQHLYPPTFRLTFDHLRSDDVTVMFVFDGLDEYDKKLDLFNTELYGAEPYPTSMDVLVVNLLRGRLLQGAQFLVTTRSQVTHSIPWDTLYHEVQLHGFCSAARDEYFRKRFKDREQCERILALIGRVKSLHAMCHLPLFCSLLADECQRVFDACGTQVELPDALTHVHTRLLLALVRQRRSLRAAERSPQEERVFLMEVGRLAFSMLMDGCYMINTTTGRAWDSCSVDEEAAVDHSGVCTQFLIRPQVLHVEKMLSFIHPMVQEYMAALYAYLSFINHGTNVFELKHTHTKRSSDIISFYSCAVDRSLQYSDGKLDVFLRFLFGLSVEINVELLQPLCSSPPPPSFINEAAMLLRNKIRENECPEKRRRRSNLQNCLQELRVSTHFTQELGTSNTLNTSSCVY